VVVVNWLTIIVCGTSAVQPVRGAARDGTGARRARFSLAVAVAVDGGCENHVAIVGKTVKAL